ncbi:MAG TPA: SusC/RagA family TonB-linked outer membrane protein [Gemmatimonadales bacterium]
MALALLAGASAQAQAQNAVITGRVTSEQGQPLTGANVYITELNVSVGTNQTGNYTLTIPAARVSGQAVVLRVRSVGFSPQHRNITLSAGTHTENFALRPDVTRLSEVVVTGVSAATEAIKVPFAVTQVNEGMMPVKGTNPISQLQGKVPGANIISASGRPGAAPAVVLRGPGSINATDRSQGPLYIVDGVLLQGGLPDLNPNDIENIEVVKGAAAASLYGARAGGGVINITTKSGAGAEEGIRFGFRTEYGQSAIPRAFSIAQNHWLPMDPTGQMYCANVVSGGSPCARYIDMEAERRRINDVSTPHALTPQAFLYDAGVSSVRSNRELAGIFSANTWPVEYDQVGQATTASPFTTINGDMQGRVGNTGFFASIGYTDQEGGFKFLGGMQRTTARLNLDQKLGDKVSLQMNNFYSQVDEGGYDQEGGAAFFRLSRQPAFVQQGTRDGLGRLFIRSNPLNQGDQNFNPLYHFENEEHGSGSTRYLGSGQIKYTPLDWLDVTGDFAYDRSSGRQFYQEDRGFRTTSPNPGTASGYRWENAWDDRSMNTSIGFLARPEIFESLGTQFSLRYLYDQQDNGYNRGWGDNLAVPGLETLGATIDNRTVGSQRTSVRSQSVFGGVDLDYLERYILLLSLRYEGSSLFGSQERWHTYPRAAVTWIASDEPWWPVPDALSLLKFRGSVGQAGNRPNFASQYETYTIGSGGALNPSTLGNPLLKPELVTETEVGFDAELFQRVGLSVTYAQSTAEDQILQVPAPAASGFGSQWQNAGALQNKTWEATLEVPIIQRADLNWSTRLIYDRNRAVITRLDVPEYTMPGGPQGAESMYFVREGERLGTIYGRSFVMNCNELPGAFASDCGSPTSSFQRNDDGFIVWTGGKPVTQGFTNNYYQAQLPGCVDGTGASVGCGVAGAIPNAPWNHRINWGLPILRRDSTNAPLIRPLGTASPDFHMGLSSNLSWKRLSVYGLLDGVFGRDVWNEGFHWAQGDFMSGNTDQGGKSVETVKPLGYYWRAGPGTGGHASGIGGLYDVLGPTSNSVEDASFIRLREVSVTYNVGALMGTGDWTVGVVGRNLMTITDYRGYDPEVGRGQGQLNSAALNGIDYFTFPNLRTLTFQLSSTF